jgi:hypothetical protein
MKIRILSAFALLAPLAALAEGPSVHQCRTYVQARIDMVDAEMRKGPDTSQGHKLLERRDKLRTQLASCEKNPSAYKKAL